jgi:putative transcriptional regulator
MNKQKQRSPFAERVLAGLNEIIQHLDGKIKLKTYVVSSPAPAPAFTKADVHAIRDRLKASEISFAQLLNVPIGTVRLWESGKRRPSGAAARLLQIYSERPDIAEAIFQGKNGQPVTPRKRKKVVPIKA